MDEHLTGWRLYTVIACLFFGSFLIALDINIINVALPRITTDFHSLPDVAWYGTAYLLTVTAFQPVYGSWYRYFYMGTVYRLSIVAFELGSVVCAASANSDMFIVGRAIAGFGAAGVLQGALNIISQVVPLAKRPLYMSVVISVFIISNTAGPLLGGALTQRVTWRWCFWINLPMGAIVLIGLGFFLRMKKNSRVGVSSGSLREKLNGMDPLGCTLFMGTVACLLLALQWGGQTKPWGSSDVIGTLSGAALLGTVFILWQWKAGEKALIPIRVFRQRSILTGAVALFFLGAQNYVLVFFVPFWFQAAKGHSPVSTGIDLIPYLLSQLVALIGTGAIVKCFGHYVPYMVAGELIALAGEAMLTQLHVDTSTLYWAFSMVVTGIGCGMAMQLPYTAVSVVLPDEDIPVGNAIAVLFYQLGGAVFISCGQTVMITALLRQLRKNSQLDAAAVITAGAAGLASLAQSPEVFAELRSFWNIAILHTVYIGIAVLAASIPFTLGMEWLNAVKIAKAHQGLTGEVELEPSIGVFEVIKT